MYDKHLEVNWSSLSDPSQNTVREGKYYIVEHGYKSTVKPDLL